MKQYVGLVRDHSGSMRSVSRAALADYNNTIEDLRLASQRENYRHDYERRSILERKQD